MRPTLHRLGRLRQRLNFTAEAERAYHLALRVNPARPSTLNNLAVLRMAALDYSEQTTGLRWGFLYLGSCPRSAPCC